MDKTSSMYLYVKLNWDANRFLPAESNDCMSSASYESLSFDKNKTWGQFEKLCYLFCKILIPFELLIWWFRIITDILIYKKQSLLLCIKVR